VVVVGAAVVVVVVVGAAVVVAAGSAVVLVTSAAADVVGAATVVVVAGLAVVLVLSAAAGSSSASTALVVDASPDSTVDVVEPSETGVVLDGAPSVVEEVCGMLSCSPSPARSGSFSIELSALVDSAEDTACSGLPEHADANRPAANRAIRTFEIVMLLLNIGYVHRANVGFVLAALSQ